MNLADLTQYYDDEDRLEHQQLTTTRRCPECEKPTQFGELCSECREEMGLD